MNLFFSPAWIYMIDESMSVWTNISLVLDLCLCRESPGHLEMDIIQRVVVWDNASQFGAPGKYLYLIWLLHSSKDSIAEEEGYFCNCTCKKEVLLNQICKGR